VDPGTQRDCFPLQGYSWSCTLARCRGQDEGVTELYPKNYKVELAICCLESCDHLHEVRIISSLSASDLSHHVAASQFNSADGR